MTAVNNEFIDCLNQQHETVTHFVTLLAEEQTLLSASPVDADGLFAVIERKKECAATLEALERRRHDILMANGYSPDRRGAEAYARTLGCDAQWQAFIAAVSQAQTHNRVNGLSIQTRLEFHQRALQFLQSAAGVSLYGPNGQTSGLSNKSIYSRV